MDCAVSWQYLLIFSCYFLLCHGQLRGKVLKNVEKIVDVKEFKKIIRTKNNVMAVFVPGEESAVTKKAMPMLAEASDQVFGKAVFALIDCNNDEARKVCKKFKVNPTSALVLKHYHNGEFHKDYDRLMRADSLIRFLNDPTGDVPWEEEPSARDVVHAQEPAEFYRFLKKEKRPILAMIYAPWCQHCKKLKPEFASAATELKSYAALAAADVARSELSEIARKFDVQAYPTLLYFENGKMQFLYGGEMNRDAIVSWMKNPQPPKEVEKEKDWDEDENSDVLHLGDSDFDAALAQHSDVLVMFYAPWCGHCKNMKPEYDKAARHLRNAGIAGIVAAVDATKHKVVGERFEITGFPTVKFFKDGQFQFDVNERTADKIIEFMKDPKEPPPPPPPETPWSETDTKVVHLTTDTFHKELKKKKHALTMFYAPWCGHCKAAKPEYDQTADYFDDDPKVLLAAVDCTLYHDLCDQHGVKGFPTLVYMSYLDKEVEKYEGGRSKDDFVQFLDGKRGVDSKKEEEVKEEKKEDERPPPPESIEFGSGAGADVLVLNKGNFEETVKGKDRIVIMFYAPWCGHCKRAKPYFIRAAKELKDNTAVGFAAVDCTQQADLCLQNSAKAYPTIQIFENGKKVNDFRGDRTVDNFVSAALGKGVKQMAAPGSEPTPTPTPAEPAEDWKRVQVLNKDNFESTLSGVSKALVMFYAPWCGHCKRAKPEFIRASEWIPQGTMLAAVDCDVEKEICQQNDVKGYPTLYFFENGKKGEVYNKPRLQADFVKSLRGKEEEKAPKLPELKKVEKPAEPDMDWGLVKLLTADNYQSTLDGAAKSFVMFFAPWCGHCKRAKPEFAAAAKQLPEDNSILLAAVDCTVLKEFCSKNEIKGIPTFYFFENGKRGEKYNGGRTTTDFVKALTATEPAGEKKEEEKPTPAPTPKPSEPAENWESVKVLDKDNFKSILDDVGKALVMFFAPWCGHCKRAKPDFIKASTLIPEGTLLAAVDCTLDNAKALCSEYGVKGFPTFLFFENGKMGAKYGGGRTTAEFVSVMAPGKAEEKKEEKPTPAPSEPAENWESVKVLDKDNFKSTLADVGKALVMFFAPWCGHCKRAKPDFIKASTLIPEGTDTLLAAVDCTLENVKALCSEHGVKGFPTFLFFEKGKMGAKYGGGRTTAEFVTVMASGKAEEKKEEKPKPTEAPGEDWGKVRVLDAVNFDDTLKPANKALVMFFAPWCGHCKRAKPGFIKASSMIPEGTLMASVDCTVHKDLCSKHEIRGYPTIYMFEKGERKEKYSGARDADGFSKAVQVPEQKKPKKEEL